MACTAYSSRLKQHKNWDEDDADCVMELEAKREQKTDNEKHKTEYRKQKTENRKWKTETRMIPIL